jgi:hypothetical protein
MMDVWVMQFPNGFIGVKFLSERAQVWAIQSEYPFPLGLCMLAGFNEYQELLDNLIPGFVVVDDGGKIHG